LTKVCVDLFSGLGSFSQAFLSEDWEVCRYDIEPYFVIKEIADDSRTTIIDIMELEPDDLPFRPDVMLISPPCTPFSVGAVSTHWTKSDDGNHTPKSKACKVAIELVRRILWLKDQIEPKFWVLENPRAMMRRVMKDILGRGDFTIETFWAAWGERHYKPTYLWGRLPEMEWPKPVTWEKAPRGSKTGTQGIKREKECMMPRELTTPMLRSLIPYEFSLALRKAIERQQDYESKHIEPIQLTLEEAV